MAGIGWKDDRKKVNIGQRQVERGEWQEDRAKMARGQEDGEIRTVREHNIT